jgi:glycosyltransferase involved in cell wall biosynthesis
MILADIPTYRELWGEAALYFDPRDPSDLAHVVNALIASPLQRREYGSRALLHSRAYTLRGQADALRRIYERVLLSSTPAGLLLEQNA